MAEFANNIIQSRFEDELIRLESYKYPFVILEFTMDDIMKWPYGSLPKHIAKFSKISKYFILRRLNELELKYKTKFILAGKHGQEYAESLFRRMLESNA